jgi:hypothetical protein
MDSNTHSTPPATRPPDGLAGLAEAVEALAAQDLDRLPDVALAGQVLELRRLLDRLEGHWLKELAAVDGRGAAGDDQEQDAASTAAWLRSRLRLGAGDDHTSVRTARALFRGPLAATGQALTDGAISVAHAQVLAAGTQELAPQVIVDAEPVLVEAAVRLDPPRLRRVLGHLLLVADPDRADAAAERRHGRRGLWLSATWEGLVAINGLLQLRPARVWWRRWSRWPAPPTPTMLAAVANATLMRWLSWPDVVWRGSGCPRLVGSARS